MYDLIIIGAGPSGLASAIYGKRAGLNVLVLESNNVGGQVSSAHIIENYPGMSSISGFDLVMAMYEQAMNLGADFEYDKAIKIEVSGKTKIVYTEANKFEAKAVVLATGVIPRKLGLENEDKFIGHGISYCAICDGAFYKGKDVCIVGGGNSATMEACYLAKYCTKVYILQDLNDLTCDVATRQMVENTPNIVVYTQSKVTELIGNDEIESVVVNNSLQLKVSGVFVSIGKIPSNNHFSNVCNLDKFGYFDINESLDAGNGIFIAGDCRVKEIRQISTATSDGAIAAIKASQYIKKIN